MDRLESTRGAVGPADAVGQGTRREAEGSGGAVTLFLVILPTEVDASQLFFWVMPGLQ